MSGPIFHRSPMQPSRILIRPTSRSCACEFVSSTNCSGPLPVILKASSLLTDRPWNGIPTVVTGPGRDALTIPIGVLNEVDTSPRRTQPIVLPSRLIGMPTVSCLTTSFVPCIVGPLPPVTKNGAKVLLPRLDLCSANALKPVTIAPITRSGIHLEIVAGKASDCNDAIQPKIRVVNVSPTNTPARFQRRETSVLPTPEFVSVRRSRPRKNRPKPMSSRSREYCSSPTGCLISQMMPRSMDKPPKVLAARLNASDILESRPISINLFSSQRFAHQC